MHQVSVIFIISNGETASNTSDPMGLIALQDRLTENMKPKWPFLTQSPCYTQPWIKESVLVLFMAEHLRK